MTVYFQSFWGTILMYESGKISKKKNNEFNVQICMQCNLSIFIKLTVDEIVIHELLFFSSLLFPQFSTLISFELMRHFPHRLSL